MALGDSHAGGGTGTGEWAAGAGADWGGGNGVGFGGWGGFGGTNPNANIDWASIIGPMPGTVDFNLPDFNIGGAGGGAISGGGGQPAIAGGMLSDMLFDQTPVTSQVPDLLTDLSQIPQDVFGPQPMAPSMAVAPSFSMVGLNPQWSDLEDTDFSTANVNERDARTVAGVAMAENRGNGGLGMQTVMNAAQNRAANDWGGFGTGLVGQMTAPGQFAAPYTGAIDPNTMDMARQALAGTLPDLTSGAQSFRADRESANHGVHQALEQQGSQALYGHVFSDYAPSPQMASIPTPPERPAEFGGSYMGLEGTGGAPAPAADFGLLADTLQGPTFDAPAPSMAAQAPSWFDSYGPMIDSAMGAARGAGSSIASALGGSWGPTNSIYDRVQEYTEPTGITGPKDYTERAPSYREQPAPTLDQQMAAARSDLAARMEQRGRDVAAGGFSFPYGEQRPSLAAFADSPTALAAAQGLQGPTYAQAPAPEQSWAGSFLSGVIPSAQAAAPDPYGFSGLSPATGRGMQEVLTNWSGQYASTPPSMAQSAAPPAMPAPIDVPSMPEPRGYSPPSTPMPPERPAEFSQAAQPAASSGITMSDVAKYGMPLVGGLVGGPAGALAGAGLYAAGSWLSGLGGAGSAAGGPPVSNPFGYGSQGDYSQPQGTGTGSGSGAGAAPAPAPVAPVKKQAIHMPSRGSWLYL
jgi:hypothetical protein